MFKRLIATPNYKQKFQDLGYGQRQAEEISKFLTRNLPYPDDLFNYIIDNTNSNISVYNLLNFLDDIEYNYYCEDDMCWHKLTARRLYA